MKRLLFAVRDRVALVYMAPFLEVTEAAALRAFSDAAADQQTQLSKHPEDFDLYHLGSFDDSDGAFEILERPVQISPGRRALNRKKR